MLYISTFSSPVGRLTAASDVVSLSGLWIEGQKHFFTPSEQPIAHEDLAIFRATRDWLDRYFAGKRPTPQELPLAPQGSDFRQTVWQCLMAIPYGKTTTYGAIATDVARQLGKSAMSAQAVGGAVGHNPISIIIPCHRVIGADGSLTGYDGGLDIKRYLLIHEGYTHFT